MHVCKPLLQNYNQNNNKRVPHFWLPEDAPRRCGKKAQRHRNSQHKTDTETPPSSPLPRQFHHDLLQRTDLHNYRKPKRERKLKLNQKVSSTFPQFLCKQKENEGQTRSRLMALGGSVGTSGPRIGVHFFDVG